MRDLHHLDALVHGQLAQLVIGLLFAQRLALHQDALGAVYGLAVLEFVARVLELGAQRLLVLEARHRHLQDGAYALRRQAFDDIGADARGHGIGHMRGVGVVGEQHDGPALVARGHDHMLERVARIAFGIDDDQIGAQLRDALMQEDIGRQRGHDVVLRLEQAHAQ